VKRYIVQKICPSLVVLLVLLAAVVWFFPEQILSVDSGPVKADAMVVLGGAGPDRVERAEELFKAGEAPQVICSGCGDDVANEKFLVKAGVPAKDISLEGKSRTTRENAEFSIAMIRALDARRVIIVTSWYHSRRALMCFEHYAPDIRFYSRPSYFGYVGQAEDGESAHLIRSATTFSPSDAEKEKAQRKAEWKTVRGYADSEYLKLLGYWVCYGISPL
jgi:uncharacterized SAM-binding protein YcdF (DUF218 family)